MSNDTDKKALLVEKWYKKRPGMEKTQHDSDDPACSHCTGYAGVLNMAAVRFGPAGKLTLVDGYFSPSASNVVHPDHTSTCVEQWIIFRDCLKIQAKVKKLKKNK